MNKKIIVFDFDKTLTYKDTLLGYYIISAKKGFIPQIKFFSYFIIMVLCKLKLISNNQLKIIGFNLFIKGQNISNLELKAKKYALRIKFNKLFNAINFMNKNTRTVIISASYEIYLKYIFPKNIEVIGTSFISEYGVAKKFDINCFSDIKKVLLKKKGINKIDKLYTDSYSDKSLAEISEKIIIVNNDTLIECYNMQDFKTYFSK